MLFYEISSNFNLFLENENSELNSLSLLDMINRNNDTRNNINSEASSSILKLNYKIYDFSPNTKCTTILSNNINKRLELDKLKERALIIENTINNYISFINYNTDCIDYETKKLILDAKTKINYNKNLWNKVKTITNDYEFVCINNCKLFEHNIAFKTKYIGSLRLKYNNTTVYINTNNLQISKLSTLSRSFYKMIEMINVFFSNHILDNNLTTLHLAEGPGGFIEAIAYIKNKYCSAHNIKNNDNYYGITLLNNNINVPNWNKSIEFLKNNKNVKIITGIDNKGDLLNVHNIKYLYTRFKNNKCDLITGDGGFDFSDNVKNQEIIASKLIWAQFISGLACLKLNGTFILKIFDINNKLTIDILFMCYLYFGKVYIYKPQTSRLANSEKYIVCQEFKGCNSYNLDNYINILDEWNKVDDANTVLYNKILTTKLNNIKQHYTNYYYRQVNNIIFDTLFIPYLNNFYKFIKHINKEIISNQLNNINTTLYLCNLLKTKKLYFKTINNRLCIQKLNAKQWCIDNNIEYYP